ncbi:MAG: formylglycine-generating enzyme family protein [Paludibacteraceae bacterium]|nr:formylglycine-generating enzyme family protein [Paludibacteraceae bacterium]
MLAYTYVKKGKLAFCLITIGTMLLTGCAKQKNDTSISQSQEQDSVAPVSVSTPSEIAEKPVLTIFDKLANNMVYVEKDSGAFYICKYEVTQQLWSEVMGENPSQMQGDDLPVEQVSWDDCQVFIGKLNKLTGKNYRLPTEEEWEFACRGGKCSKGYNFSGSDNLDEVAWYDGNSEGKTHPVGQKQPNELGLYDMSGNVWELCQNMHGASRVCRGGSWIHNARNCDPSLDNETPQSFKINSLGLRLAL